MVTRKTPAANGKSVQEQLDEALADSFPASDPVSLVTSQTEEDWEEAEEAPPPDGTPAKATPCAGRQKDR